MEFFVRGFIVLCVLLLLSSGFNAIRVIGHNKAVTAGSDAHLFCQVLEATGKLTSITWQRRTKEKPTNTDFMIIASDGKEEHVGGLKDRVKFIGDISRLNGSVLLSNVTLSDEGIYTCVFSIFPIGPSNTELKLTVLIPPVVSVSTDVHPVAGETEEILATCTAANAKPAAEVLWSRGDLKDSVKVQNNQTVDSDGRVTVTSSLIGVASKELNQKEVRCSVSHPGLNEKKELDYTLNIHYPPQIVYITSTASQGETQEFLCDVDANPKPNCNWSRTYPAREHLYNVVDERLIIQTTPDCNGLYFCVASNEYGKAVGSLYVHVIAAPGITVCWTLFIIVFIAVVCCFLTWKFELHQHIVKRCWTRRDPVSTDSLEAS